MAEVIWFGLFLFWGCAAPARHGFEITKNDFRGCAEFNYWSAKNGKRKGFRFRGPIERFER